MSNCEKSIDIIEFIFSNILLSDVKDDFHINLTVFTSSVKSRTTSLIFSIIKSPFNLIISGLVKSLGKTRIDPIPFTFKRTLLSLFELKLF